MHKLMVLYPEPDDRQAFLDHYTNTHIPLVEKLPGMLGWHYSVDVADDAPYFAVFEADFQDARGFRSAMESPQGQAVAADVPNYATGGAVVFDYAVSGGA